MVACVAAAAEYPPGWAGRMLLSDGALPEGGAQRHAEKR